MTNNIKRLVSGFSALALMLGGVIIPAGNVFSIQDETPSDEETTVSDYQTIEDQYLSLGSGSLGNLPTQPEGYEYVVADESIVKIEERTSESCWGDGESEPTCKDFVYEVLVPVAEGETTVSLVNGETVVDEANITVYSISTNLKRVQAVGTSQTFGFELSDGYSVDDVVVASEAFSTANENEYVELADNEDGTYNLTVNKMPRFTNAETGKESNSPIAFLSVTVKTPDSTSSYSNFMLMFFEFDVDDEGDDKAIIMEAVAGAINEVIDNADGAPEEGDSMEAELEDGTIVQIGDLYGFVNALVEGDKLTGDIISRDPLTVRIGVFDDTELPKAPDTSIVKE